MKDHEKRELVTRVARTAWDAVGTEQLRERVAHELLPTIDALCAENERLRNALHSAIATLERDGDEWGICGQLRAALTPNA